ncbi:MAG: hypothetical protein HUU16_12755 [Candidatus Omnitrophica bacterium]|nr:hypothetical protein [bacterium]NUN97037.1 hypothetical protein [Candidatus Omnitrophota bacterium]
MSKRTFSLLFMGALCGASFAADFTAPQRITNGAAKYNLSRTPNSILALDSAGKLHLTYWSGGIQTTPGTPSYVYYRSWTVTEGFSPQVSIDDSRVGPNHVGGRHPSITVTADNTVWVVWHDHRDSTADGNWINNVEIYGDRLPPGGSFGSTDIRLTNTNAGHPGDNGYTPKIARGPDGRLSLAWYDSHFSSGDFADIFLKTSDPLGVFDLGEPMSAMRLTDLADHPTIPYSVPDFAVDSSGTRHLAWAGGYGPDVNLYYAAAPLGATTVQEVLLAPGATDFFDPPRMVCAPNGDVWIACGDDSNPQGEDVVLFRRRAGQPTFDPPISIAPDPARQYAPDLEVDSQGKVHLVWVDERGGAHVLYGVYDPLLDQLLEEQPVTPEPGNWARPSLALGPDGDTHVIWEEDRALGEGDIWFCTTKRPPTSSVEAWSLYE